MVSEAAVTALEAEAVDRLVAERQHLKARATEAATAGRPRLARQLGRAVRELDREIKAEMARDDHRANPKPKPEEPAIVPNPSEPGEADAKKLYQAFMGRRPHTKNRYVIPNDVDLPPLAELGPAHSLSYVAAKSHDGGSPFVHVHKFDSTEPPVLLAHPSGNMLVILGKGLRVTDAGVEG